MRKGYKKSCTNNQNAWLISNPLFRKFCTIWGNYWRCDRVGQAV